MTFDEKRNTTSPHRACVITPRAAHYGNGAMVPVPATLHRELPAILHGTLGRFARHSTIIIDGAMPVALPVSCTGWNYSKTGPWTLYHRDDGRTVAVGYRDAMNPRHFGVLVHPDTEPGVLAMLLDRYQQCTGLSWRGTCATTALAGIRLSWENVQYPPRWNHAKVDVGNAAGPLIWSRPLNQWETSWGWVHTFDAAAAYLGSALNASLAWSTLEPTGPRPFTKTAPGYWQVRLAASTLAWADDPGRPPLLPAGRVEDGCVWLTTPYAELLGELGDPLDVIDSITAVDGRRVAGYRVLRTWGEQMRDARVKAAALSAEPFRDLLAYAVKRTYKDATGGMQRPGMRVFRPDWAHTLIDLWRATLMRRLIRVHQTQGIWPVAVKTDAVSYADCCQRPTGWLDEIRVIDPGSPSLAEVMTLRSCGLDRCGCAPAQLAALGTYRHQATTTTETWLTAMQSRKQRRETVR